MHLDHDRVLAAANRAVARCQLRKIRLDHEGDGTAMTTPVVFLHWPAHRIIGGSTALRLAGSSPSRVPSGTRSAFPGAGARAAEDIRHGENTLLGHRWQTHRLVSRNPDRMLERVC